MFTKPLSELTYDDIEYLIIEKKEQESYYLDYKVNVENNDTSKEEIAKDVSAFANAGGGHLIYGIKDESLDIVGIHAKIGNQDFVSWFNNVVKSNVDPKIFYPDPVAITIPNSDKIIVVVYIPESSRKPHMHSKRNVYYIRENKSSEKAKHQQVRDMFEFARNRQNEFDNFLAKRNLLDENSIDFGKNYNSKMLYSQVTEHFKELPKPILLLSLVPKSPLEDKFSMDIHEFRVWLESATNKSNILQNYNFYSIYSAYENSMINGVTYYCPSSDSKKINETRSYLEIQENGFIEIGNSILGFYAAEIHHKTKPTAHLSNILMAEILLLEFAKKFYEHIEYYDEVMIQISLVNVLDYVLVGFHKHFGERYYYREVVTNKYYPNIKISHIFNPSKLEENDIMELVKQSSLKLCRAFGIAEDKGVVDNKISYFGTSSVY
ncbi:MAG: ATP-binding protein [Rickettsiaceae bacterium]|nr:ATP-binding protein [Rickettsiaceae bacterium]